MLFMIMWELKCANQTKEEKLCQIKSQNNILVIYRYLKYSKLIKFICFKNVEINKIILTTYRIQMILNSLMQKIKIFLKWFSLPDVTYESGTSFKFELQDSLIYIYCDFASARSRKTSKTYKYKIIEKNT